MSNNQYGLDNDYFERKIAILHRDGLKNWMPDELARELARMSRTADKSVMQEPEFAAPVVERQETVVIDLDAVDWESIQQAADESNWMPNEYMRNEWVADVCNFLKYGRADASPPAPVSVVLPFADKVISKLRRYQECTDDGQGADIGRHWFDLLTQLGLLNRVQRSPAIWEITQQGEDCLDKVKEPRP